MKSSDRENKYQSVAFQLLAIKSPQARYKFVKSGKNSKDFFEMSIEHLVLFGFKRDDILVFKRNYTELAEEEINKAEKNSVSILFRNDPGYPALLKEIFDPPSLLYILGDTDVLKTKSGCLGVVGSRKGNSYGRTALGIVLPPVVREGIPVISGMAYGIDSIAHDLTLKEGGKTIGVNAGGLLRLYPSGNNLLTKKIAEKGCIISEFPLDTIPRPFLFPIRNRIISGLSKAVLLVQAEMRSGSLITARLGMEQNRDILSIPGPISDPLSSGTNYLIKQGAKPVTSPMDILEEFGIEKQKQIMDARVDLTNPEKKFLDLISVNEVKGIDYFVERSGISVSEVITVLMGMVLKNIIVEERGGFRRIV